MEVGDLFLHQALAQARVRRLAVQDDPVHRYELGEEDAFPLSRLDLVLMRQARPARFDLVVTDQLMPRMSGTELATRLRAIRPDIPVLLMSGFGGPELAHKARRAAVHALLKKAAAVPRSRSRHRQRLERHQDIRCGLATIVRFRPRGN